MSQAQQITHLENLKAGRYNKNQKLVLEAIRQGRNTIETISMFTGLPIRTVSGRLTELNDIGKIKPGGTARLSFYVEVTDPQEIKTIIRERLTIKYNKAVKNLEKYGNRLEKMNFA